MTLTEPHNYAGNGTQAVVLRWFDAVEGSASVEGIEGTDAVGNAYLPKKVSKVGSPSEGTTNTAVGQGAFESEHVRNAEEIDMLRLPRRQDDRKYEVQVVASIEMEGNLVAAVLNDAVAEFNVSWLDGEWGVTVNDLIGEGSELCRFGDTADGVRGDVVVFQGVLVSAGRFGSIGGRSQLIGEHSREIRRKEVSDFGNADFVQSLSYGGSATEVHRSDR